MTNKTIPAEKARQGRNGLRVVAVLVVALALAAVVWVGLEFWGEAIDSQNIEQSGQSADQ
jgi:uncharacterized protein HemX